MSGNQLPQIGNGFSKIQNNFYNNKRQKNYTDVYDPANDREMMNAAV